MLIRDAKLKVDIPHEDGEWVQIRRLTWRELDEARERQQLRALTNMKAMGADVLEALRSSNVDAGEQQRNPEQAYDRATVLNAGVVDWSYDAEVTSETIGDLDSITADWLFRRIIQQHEESDEAKKKDSPPSTAH